MKSFFTLFKLTLREKKRLTLAFVSNFFIAVFTYLFVNLIQPIMDQMFHTASQSVSQKVRLLDVVFQKLNISEAQLVSLLPLMLVLVMFGKSLFTFFANFHMRTLGHSILKQLREEIYEHLVYQPSRFFDHKSTGELMSRVTNDVDRLQDAVSLTMGNFLRELFTLSALLVGIFVIDWQLSLSIFILLPLAVIPLTVFNHQLRKKRIVGQVKMARMFTLLHEVITGNKIVKAFTMEKFEMKKFKEAVLEYFKTAVKLARLTSVSSPFMEFIGAVVGALILILGTMRISQGSITPGDFGAFLAAMFLMYDPIRRLTRANNIIQQGVACYFRIQELMKEVPESEENPKAYPLPPVKGRVKYEHVYFSYNQKRPVLHDINLDVRPAETVALVGLSGSGKTTMVNLLSRFYRPTSGRITIDGIDIGEVTLSSLRKQIGLVTQDVILFNDTVRNNIAYGEEGVSMEMIVQAARAAKAHDFIIELPKGYETRIGEKGKLLSGGQQQRLAIARALLKNPPLLILDEATSSLDSESERLIQVALETLMKNRTTFVIAHRLSTIMKADKIVVVDRGRVVEVGSHKELINKDGIYRKLYELQFPEEVEVRT
ncbi:MAG: ABC transporter ATP-binding protein [Candidatus Aminicenantales bacterium]